MSFTLIALVCTSMAMYWLCFMAPMMKTPAEIEHPELIKKEEEIPQPPWYVTGGVIAIICICNWFPILIIPIFIILGAAGLFFFLDMPRMKRTGQTFKPKKKHEPKRTIKKAKKHPEGS